MSGEDRRQNWFSGRSLKWRMWVLAVVLGGFVVTIGMTELFRERTVFQRELREAAQAQRVGLMTTLEVTEREMLHTASLLAVDPEVQYYMKRAHTVLAGEGGGAGGEQTTKLREVFSARIDARREHRWSEELAARQVEFHLGPGAVNFLRVRSPRRFGDLLDEVRPMVAVTHELDIPASGFEVGRMYAGLRGLHPILVSDSGEREQGVGSVEVGIAMRDLLSHATSRFGAEFALALAPELVDGVMWEDDIRAGLRWSDNCRCYIDAQYELRGPFLLQALESPHGTPFDGHRLAEIGGRWYGITRVALTGFFDRIGGVPPVGDPASIFIFTDRTALVASHKAARVNALIALAAAYLFALLLAWITLRRIAATEEALDAAKRFRSALFMLSPDSVLVTDREGTVREVNPRFCEVTGYRPEEIVGKNARALQSGLTPPEVYGEMWATLLAGKEWRGDLQNRRKNGSFYWEAHAIVPVSDAQGEITRFVSFQRDVSERHEMERALAASERLYRSIHDNVEEAIFVVHVDPDGFRFLANNPRHQHATGLSAERIGGARPQDVFPPEVAESVCQGFRRCIEAGETIRFEEEHDLPAGHRHWMTSLTPVRGDSGMVELIVGLAVDVTEQKATEDELRRLATTDVLTGLANRRHFLDRATRELGRVRRYASPSAFMMLDIDHFKSINDTWGHATGDTVLRTLAGIMTSTLRDTDLVGRLGGEEFGVLLPETDMDSALALAERLREAVTDEQVSVEGDVLRFSASFGVTLFHADDDSVDMPMARADAALYAAKFAGRNRVKWRVR